MRRSPFLTFVITVLVVVVGRLVRWLRLLGSGLHGDCLRAGEAIGERVHASFERRAQARRQHGVLRDYPVAERVRQAQGAATAPGGSRVCDGRRSSRPLSRQDARYSAGAGSLRAGSAPAAGRDEHDESCGRDEPRHLSPSTRHQAQRSLAFAAANR